MKPRKRIHYGRDTKAAMIYVAIYDKTASDLISKGLDVLTFEQIKALVPVVRQISRGLPK